MKIPTSDEWSSVSMFRLIGYILLLLAVFDVVSILLTPGPINSEWQLQAIGMIVERTPLPLIGLVMVFAGEANVRQKWERVALRGLSWGALIIGILLLVTIPLLLNATVQVNLQNDSQVTTQSEQQLTQLQTIEKQLNVATPQDLDGFLARLNQQSNTATQFKDPQSMKRQLLTEVDQAKKSLNSQTELTRNGQRTVVLKNAAKWSLGALVVGIAFIRLWQMSHWARRKQRTRLKPANA